MDRSRVTLAEIFRPRGLRGELTARSLTDIPGRLESLKQAHVRLADGTDRKVELIEVWQHKGDWVLKFAGVDTMDAANEFRGADLWVPVSERAALPDGEYFQSDLTGCEVVDRATGSVLGVVKGWQEYGGPPLMELTLLEPGGAGREVLIPFVASECQIDLGARVIRMSLPEGLLDL
jgi:16S rRNA processing protein RimM